MSDGLTAALFHDLTGSEARAYAVHDISHMQCLCHRPRHKCSHIKTFSKNALRRSDPTLGIFAGDADGVASNQFEADAAPLRPSPAP